MPHFICVTCGTQFPASEQQPAACPICQDERQYVGWKGQQWTTLDQLRADHHAIIREEEPCLTGIGCEPSFAIGQRAQLVQTPEGNLLWECLTLIDDAAIAAVRERGGLAAIAISHPHYYSSMIEWSQAFGGVPIYLHAAERQWVLRPDPAVIFWEGETRPLFGGLTLIRCGGHFTGAQVCHWPAGAQGRGALLAGDILNVVSDRRWLSFMYSYPNLIPLNASTVRRMAAAVAPFEFDRIYSAWFDKTMDSGAKAAVGRSVERYLNAIKD
jgi:glyoxylase-like metal-dependent hydrolase (beta-lactamase superfamily II)